MIHRCALLLICLVMASCGSGELGLTSGAEVSLTTVLSELQELDGPPGVSPDQFEGLKQSLAAALKTSGKVRFTSAAPAGLGGSVSNLTGTVQSGALRLDWTYANKGDYDQNRQVNISDLSTLGPNLGKTTASPDWLSKAVTADGDANGEVNISDITPIGANFLATVEGYLVQTTVTPSTESSWQTLAEVMFDSSSIPIDSALRRFAYEVSAPVHGNWYRVAPYDGADVGAPGNAVQYSLALPQIAGVNPTSGESATAVQFHAILSGGTPASWAWDFGGGATPDLSTNPVPAVTLGAVGSYPASLTVTNDAGSDTFEFTLHVIAPPLPEVENVTPTIVYEGQQRNFVAALSGGVANTYSWDFGGGASPDTSTEVSPLVTFNAAGNYDASVTVTNTTGSDSYNFGLEVLPNDAPIAVLSAMWGQDDEGNDVYNLDGSLSMDPDGVIERWEWDLDGDGEFELNTTPISKVAIPVPPPGIHLVSLRVTDDRGVSATEGETLDLRTKPVALITATPWYGHPGAPVILDASRSYDTDGTIVSYKWFLKDTEELLSEEVTWNTTLPEVVSSVWLYLVVTDNDGFTNEVPVEQPLVAMSPDWQLIPISTQSDVGGPSLSIIAGQPAVAFGSIAGLEFVRATDPAGEQWGELVTCQFNDPSAGSWGWGPSLAQVNGLPAMAFNPKTPFAWMATYISAESPQGAVWSEPVQTTWEEGRGKLFEVAGRPALTIKGPAVGFETPAPVYFLRAADATGETWPEEGELATVTPNINSWTSPLVVDGNPALATQGAGNGGGPVYVRGQDSEGTSWPSSPNEISTDAINTSCGGDLLLVNSVPALAWVHEVPFIPNTPPRNEIRYSYALNAQASAWETVTVGSHLAGSIELAVVNGKPAISYIRIEVREDPDEPDPYYSVSLGLYYVEALDTQGTSWGEPQVIIPHSLPYGTVMDMVEADGRPGIAIVIPDYWEPFADTLFYTLRD